MDSPFELHPIIAALEEGVPTLDLPGALDLHDALEQANRDLAELRHNLAGKIASLMGTKQVTLNGHTYEKNGRWRRTGWDIEQLLPTVLDTRRFDTETGALVEESDLQKVLHVWNLGTPRVTALRERGLDSDEFVQSEWAGWTIRRLG